MKHQHILSGSPITNQRKANRIFSILFLICILSGSISKSQQKAATDGLLYSVSGNGLTDSSFLFGTFHLVNSGYLSEVPAVQRSFLNSPGVVVEIIPDSAKLVAMQQQSLAGKRPLSSWFERPFTDSLDGELKQQLGAGVQQLNQLKPMAVTLTLSLTYLIRNNNVRLSAYTGKPLDAYFATTGKDKGKTITALETIEQQSALLFGRMPEEEQARGLQIFLRNKTAMISLGDELLTAWFNQDMARIGALYDSTLRLSGEEDQLIKERNENWMKVLPGLIQQQRQFIAVGALHLAGPDGLVSQLRKKGYTVTPLNAH